MRILSVVSVSALALAMMAPELTNASGSAPASREQLFISHYENVLGTSLDLKAAASSRAQADRAQGAVLHEMDRQSRILSSWSPDSEFSRWVRTHNQPVSVS